MVKEEERTVMQQGKRPITSSAIVVLISNTEAQNGCKYCPRKDGSAQFVRVDILPSR